ncbi:MAG: DUF4382 domain-containing protein [Candidatus Acidiferrales bacterium]
MRRLGTLWAFVAFASLCILPSCGKSHGTLIGNPGNQFTLTIHDAAPIGITVLSLQVQVLSATLQPGNVSVSLPETVDLALLQSDTTLLSSLQIPSGNYTSLVLDFENPSMIFINNTGGPITPALNPTCATGAICQITPVSTGGTITLRSAPVFPLQVAQGAEVAIELDLDIGDLVQGDFSLNFGIGNALNVTQLTSVQGNTQIRRLNHTLGTVTKVGSNAFTLTTPTGVNLGITTDNTTKFNFPSGCLADNFSCVRVNQVLELDVSLEGNGTLLATEVDLEADVNAVEISGLIVALDTNSPPQSFQMLVRQTSPAEATALVGMVETVELGSPTTFSVDNHSFVLPAGLTFTSAANLLVGQEVLADVDVILAPSLVIRTSTLALRRSQVTALVATAPTVGGSTFVLNSLPSIFQTALPTNILQMKVDTTTQTTFEDLTPDTLAGIIVGNNISVGGFLFNASGTATIATDQVRGQPIPAP